MKDFDCHHQNRKQKGSYLFKIRVIKVNQIIFNAGKKSIRSTNNEKNRCVKFFKKFTLEKYFFHSSFESRIHFNSIIRWFEQKNSSKKWIDWKEWKQFFSLFSDSFISFHFLTLLVIHSFTIGKNNNKFEHQ